MQKAPSRAGTEGNGACRPFPTDLHIPPMPWRSDLLTTSAPREELQGRGSAWTLWAFPVSRKGTEETFYKPGSPSLTTYPVQLLVQPLHGGSAKSQPAELCEP